MSASRCWWNLAYNSCHLAKLHEAFEKIEATIDERPQYEHCRWLLPKRHLLEKKLGRRQQLRMLRKLRQTWIPHPVEDNIVYSNELCIFFSFLCKIPIHSLNNVYVKTFHLVKKAGYCHKVSNWHRYCWKWKETFGRALQNLIVNELKNAFFNKRSPLLRIWAAYKQKNVLISPKSHSTCYITPGSNCEFLKCKKTSYMRDKHGIHVITWILLVEWRLFPYWYIESGANQDICSMSGSKLWSLSQCS